MSTTWPQMTPAFAQHVDAREPMQFPHALPEHPLLSLDAIATLAEELGEGSVSAELADKPVVTAEDESTVALDIATIAQQIRELDSTSSWFNLLNIQNVPRYRALVDDIVDNVAISSGIEPTSLSRRTGFIFASSPGAVTSAHFDIEQSLCMQLKGHRKLGMGRFADADDREREIRRYWSGVFGRMDAMPEQTHDFALAPGVGVFIPPYTPHWITNGAESSLSLTVTFFNRSNTDEAGVQAFNHQARRIGLNPPPFGQRPATDRAKATTMRAYGAVKGRLRPGAAAAHDHDH